MVSEFLSATLISQVATETNNLDINLDKFPNHEHRIVKHKRSEKLWLLGE